MINAAERHQIETRIHRELVRSIEKHGNWDDVRCYSLMVSCIMEEMSEATGAVISSDFFGDHGAFNELAQVAACCQKMMAQILRREKLMTGI